ncbi:MAG TPA: acetate/propionate family kinase [Steroidobacteraceae bacterium]|nr:acetate/propionate family kinase [Steroidobacteraceae bacterium]
MSAPVLVFNYGSSSLKVAVVGEDGRHLTDVRLTGLGPGARLSIGGAERPVAPPDTTAAAHLALDELETCGALGAGLAGVGHRVAHGGERFTVPVLIDAGVESAIAALAPLSPLHNPAALATIRAARARLPAPAHVAVFDTAFHTTLPRRSREYALPAAVRSRLGIRRYGFHGTSHAFVAGVAADWLGADLRRLRLISCHLGSGASVAAIEFGRSVDTSMGLTPLEGLVMATRPGDLDPGIMLALLRSGMSLEDLERLLNEESGLLGLAGTGDMREVEQRAAAGDDPCRLALLVYAHRLRKYVGAYAAVMGGVDAIVFTGGVGEHSAVVRHRVAQRLEFLGAELDEDRNRDASVGPEHRVAEISVERARCPLLVVATDEEYAIARATRTLLSRGQAPSVARTVPISISARHVHLTPESVGALFGAGHRLTALKPISQPGQFAAAETVTLVGPRGRIEHVRIVGPERTADQVEIARTDEFVLGVDAPVRESGDLQHTPGIRIEGPSGAITLKQGVICALRHIHMAPADAVAFGVKDGDLVDVRVDSSGRQLTFGDVVIRVREDFVLEMHVDTDEGNAAALAAVGNGVLTSVQGATGLLQRR